VNFALKTISPKLNFLFSVRATRVEDPFNEFTRYSPTGPGKDKLKKNCQQAFGQATGDDTLGKGRGTTVYQPISADITLIVDLIDLRKLSLSYVINSSVIGYKYLLSCKVKVYWINYRKHFSI
jgi:hypothetical protein